MLSGHIKTAVRQGGRADAERNFGRDVVAKRFTEAAKIGAP